MKYLAPLLALAAVAAAPTASAQFTVGGLGGLVPAVDTGTSGDRCTMLPNDIASFAASTDVPLNATGITSVELIGLNHSWVGDIQIVLRDPNGAGYNLCARINSDTAGCTGFGDSSNFAGDYTIVAGCDNPTFDFLDEATLNTDLTPGDYGQFYGVWVDGAAGISNTDISGIEATPGTWTLEIYDGGGGDTGDLIEWRMNGTTRDAGSSVGGPGGLVPPADTGTSGDRCSILPNDFAEFPATMPVTGGSSIESVTLTGLNHSWVGDVQIVLEDPAGNGYNLCARINSDTAGCTGFGDSSNFAGDYTFVPAGGGGDILAEATLNTDLTPGDYDQFYGVWIDGSAGISNTDIASIPVTPGIWTMKIYDGGGGDTGDLVEWSMNIAGATADDVCAGELNSTGVAADFSVTGSASVSANDLMLHVTDLPMGSFGFFLVGNECVNVPAVGGGMGTLCVGGDLRRGVGNTIVNSGMAGTVDLPADLMNIPTTGFGNPSGVAATPYQRLFLQYWYRDVDGGGMTTSNLSNALLVVPTM